MKVKSFAAFDPTSPLKPLHFERRAVGPSDVQIEIQYCGICHSDIHTARSEWGPASYPLVPGHEIVGKVTAVGKSVTKFKVGETVGVGCMVGSCGQCASCAEGLEQYCVPGFVGTYNSPATDGTGHTQGGYSSGIVVDQNFVLRIPAGMDPARAAPLLCAGITTYSPLRHWKIGRGMKVGIIGLGGLGHMGVKIASAMGAEVVMLTTSPKKADDAKRLGARSVLVTTDPDAMAQQAETFDFLLDTVSAQHDLTSYLNLLKREGQMVMVGAPEKPLPLPTFALIFRRKNLAGSLIGGIRETQEMLDFCAKHGITADIEMIAPEQINDAYNRMLKSDVRYRFVMDCQKL